MKKFKYLAGLVMVAGCAMQDPVSVINGYTGKHVVEKEPVVEGKRYSLSRKAYVANGEKAVVKQQVAVRQAPEAVVYENVEPAAGPVVQREVAVSEVKPVAKQKVMPKVERVEHTVTAADTVYGLASQYKTSAAKIVADNNLKSVADIKPGDVLVIEQNSKPQVSAWEQVKDMLAEPNTVQRGQEVALRGNMSESRVENPGTARRFQGEMTPIRVSEVEQKQNFSAIEPASGVPPQKGVLTVDHLVTSGETIYRIAQQYDASVLDVMTANEFEKPQDLKAGMVVHVPVNQTARVKNLAPENAAVNGKMPERQVVYVAKEAKTDQGSGTATLAVNSRSEVPAEVSGGVVTAPDGGPVTRISGRSSTDTASLPEDDGEDEGEDAPLPRQASKKDSAVDVTRAELKRGQVDPVAAKADGPVWPVRGKVVKRFGEAGGGVASTGVNIEVPVGTPVLAMDRGEVLYADEGLKTYGKLVLIRHGNGLVSAYAHNGHLLVKKGERVKKGQVIATSGVSGNVETPQLHFELRRHASAVDPMRELPQI